MNKKDLFIHKGNTNTKCIITANAAIINKANLSKRFFALLNANYVTFDGMIPWFVAKMFNKKFGFEKLSGSDIIYDFCQFAKENEYNIFFLGGKKESNQIAVYNIKNKYDITIDGYSPDFEDYPFTNQFSNLCLDKIRKFKPEILFVGFGSPKQEYWIEDNKHILSDFGVKYAIGCGGAFDFVSHSIKRAPVLIQKMGFEGIWRFIQEPNIMRLNRLIDSFKFFKYIWHRPDFTSS